MPLLTKKVSAIVTKDTTDNIKMKIILLGFIIFKNLI